MDSLESNELLDIGETMSKLANVQEITENDQQIAKPNSFNQHLIYENVLANNNYKEKNFDLNQATQFTQEAVDDLNAKSGMQLMLAAQMLSIHKLQQKAMCYAQNINNIKLEQQYINSAIKLSNCFVQQANLLAKLQGIGGQKIVVERVEVHQGGQAIVGNIHRGMDDKEKI